MASPISNEVISKEQLKQFIERIERLELDKSNITIDIKEVYNEARSSGFDIRTIRKIIRLKKLDKSKLEEEEALLELYREVLSV